MTQKTLGQWKDRPNHNSDAVYDAAARALLVEVLQWLRSNEWSGDEEEVFKELREEIHWHHRNGFEFAKTLDSNGWSVDAELVEILDGASFKISNAHQDMVVEWVKANNVKPQLAIGDKVIADLAFKGKVEGEIVKIYEDQAQYVVCCPSLGHKKGGVGVHGSLVDYEKVHPSC